MPKQKDQVHIPVLLNEVLKLLEPAAGQNYLDVTAGYGGHAQEVLSRTTNYTDSVLVDRDEQAIETLQNLFSNRGAKIIHDDFLSATQTLAKEGNNFDLILADLGISSLHLNEASRGFAFAQSGPLDMRMDVRQDLTADSIVNKWSESEIAELVSNYGEDPKAREIARRIVQARPIKTTSELAHIVAKAWPGKSRIHPATRTFQAIRIVVNDELAQLKQSLPLWVEMLNPGGRLAVISFHSLEDRIVKEFFKEYSGNTYDSELKLLTKKPITATQDEIVLNPRARSAKLRACSKNKNT